MKSLDEALKELELDLSFRPPRISAHSDMPYAIFVYPPTDEFLLRKKLRLLSIKLREMYSRRITFISISKLVWKIIKEFNEKDLYKTEVLRGFAAGELHINRLITSADFRPISNIVLEKMSQLSPENDIVFIVRAGGFAPFICRTSWLIENLHNKTMVPIILFYPGSVEEGTNLKFFNLPDKGAISAYNYRVKIYGVL